MGIPKYHDIDTAFSIFPRITLSPHVAYVQVSLGSVYRKNEPISDIFKYRYRHAGNKLGCDRLAQTAESAGP